MIYAIKLTVDEDLFMPNKIDMKMPVDSRRGNLGMAAVEIPEVMISGALSIVSTLQGLPDAVQSTSYAHLLCFAA